MGQFILVIDQGTTGTTSSLYCLSKQRIIASVNQEFTQFFPNVGWVEHDLDEIWSTIGTSIEQLLAEHKTDVNQILAIGITNQRETTCAFDKNGQALARAIVWQDRRTTEFCRQAKHSFSSMRGQEKTGLPIDPYFSGSKMRWLLEHDKVVAKAAEEGNLHFSTIDSFILYRLTNGESFFTDATNASRTLLMDLETCHWDQELLSFFHLNESYLPQIKPTFSHFGQTKNISFLPDGIPITCLIGDQQGALLGQGCVQPGDTKCTYGTGAFILSQTGNKIVYSQNSLLTTVSFQTNQEVHYALEGSCYIAGAAVQWMRDKLKIIEKASDIEALAKKNLEKERLKDLFFFPFFAGLGSPYWEPNAKASILGMTRETNDSQLAMVCLEGVAQSVCDMLETLEKDMGAPLNLFKVDGGMARNSLFLEIQSSFANQAVHVPAQIESTSIGSAFGAAIGADRMDFEAVREIGQQAKRVFKEQESYHRDKRSYWKKFIQSFYLNL
jgi:glycerol kinase